MRETRGEKGELEKSVRQEEREEERRERESGAISVVNIQRRRGTWPASGSVSERTEGEAEIRHFSHGCALPIVCVCVCV